MLGMPPSELGDPMDSPGGLVIESLADGLRYIVVPEDNPDADGKTGLMFLGAPQLEGDRVYVGNFPVYAPLPELLTGGVVSETEAFVVGEQIPESVIPAPASKGKK
jgi:hypothetical protein